ncbi:major facilitator superfamily domain-containing protein [Aspergillus ambiguus]|uniref:MFS transporter n=1 Tax=Aspergillus ambiguus TaxID=176160 RepID=UPI003CCCFFFB
MKLSVPDEESARTQASASINTDSYSDEDILGDLATDPVLNRKMHLVNNALDHIGWTPYHWKLFFLSGMGYGVDALQVSLQGIIATQAAYEFLPSYPKGLTIALYTGMLVGALFWGISADIIGRRIAFNISLFLCSVFTIVAGASPTWEALGLFIAVSAFGAGGNLILDTTVLLEYLPSRKQWLLTCLAAWWGVGCTIAGLVAWGFMPNYSCADPTKPPYTPCTTSNNSGWRYLMYTMGAMILVLSIGRVTIIRLKETPKFLLGQGKDAELSEHLHRLATQYNRSCPVDASELMRCGMITSVHSRSRFSIGELAIHLRGLFASRRLVRLMILLWLSGLMVGLAYPLFNVFLPLYLASRGLQFGVTSTYETWRNYALAQVCSIFGPIVSGYMASCRFFGRRYTMAIGGLITMAFLFAYSQVSSQAQNVAYPCVIAFTLQIYSACLYGYTVEVLPSAHRATGNGICVALRRLMGIMAAVIATEADTTTSTPVFVCAALYGGIALCAVLLPFEPYGRRAS